MMVLVAVSGTLPVLHIRTDKGKMPDSKEEYISAVYWLDPMGQSGVDAVASEAQPDTTLIKGRGNWTWNGFDKKPYRLKLNQKQSFLGMPKSKHWALMAAADDNLAYLRNPVGYYLAQQLMPEQWTPEHRPLEVVFNGQYWGLYFLTQVVRDVDDWLIEIDNYDEGYLTFQDQGWNFYITPKSPDPVSAEQLIYLADEIRDLQQAVYEPTITHLQQKLDLKTAVQYYLVQELMNDKESYHGSCYLHKANDADAVWFFGPVWDFGNSFNNNLYSYIFEEVPFEPQVWVRGLYEHSEFRDELQHQWWIFLHNVYPGLKTWIDAYSSQLTEAAKNEKARWGHSQNYMMRDFDFATRRFRLYEKLTEHVDWLRTQWGEGTEPTAQPSFVRKPDIHFYNVWGQEVLHPLPGMVVVPVEK